MPAEKKPFGFYGVIMENDIYEKIPEFTAWLIEIKGLARDELGHKEEKKLWQQFCDDYNTCTMSHEKYYTIDKWEKETGETERKAKMLERFEPKKTIEDMAKERKLKE